jgi:Fe-S-cluster containining protein
MTPTLSELRAAHRLHVAEVDATVAALHAETERRGHPVLCRAGCSACCQFWVEIGALEAMDVADELRRQGRASRSLRNRLQRAGEAMARHSPQEHWDCGRPCELLAPDGRCSVYDARPVACRLHQSIGGDCAAMTSTRIETAPILEEHGAFCRSFTLGSWPQMGPLPGMVARALAQRP